VATNGDRGLPIATAVIAEFRKQSALLPSLHSIEKIGLGGRAIARRRAENAIIADISLDRLASLDRLLDVDPSIGQTRFYWLHSAPEAPGASNLVGLTERIAFLRTLEIDPRLQMRISSGRWDQMIREGNATPAWLASDFNSSRRHALIVAQVIKLDQKLTDDAVTMFIKLMGRLFSQASNRKKQRHMDCRPDTAKALRMFLDTITALQSANDYGRNALEVLDQKVGWHRLLRMKPELESMVEGNEASPLTVAAEQYATVNKYAGAFLQAFTFQSARRHDPLLAAISLLKRLYAEKRRTLPERVPVTHLSQADRRLIFGQGKPDRRLYEIATLAALRDRLRSAGIWVDGSRSFRPIDEHLMPRSTFATMKEEDRLGLGVQHDGAAWLAEARQVLDFNLKRLAHRARSGKLEGIRRHVSPMRTLGIRIPASGATEPPLHRMANSSAQATEPPSAATSICTTAANPDRNSTAIFPISTATSAFCPSVRPKARRPMCSMGYSIRTRFSTSRNTLPIPAERGITSSGCSP
jgi:hypothetical protein